MSVEKNVIYGVRVEDTINLFSFSAIAEGACLSNEGELTDPATPRLLAARARPSHGHRRIWLGCAVSMKAIDFVKRFTR